MNQELIYIEASSRKKTALNRTNRSAITQYMMLALEQSLFVPAREQTDAKIGAFVAEWLTRLLSEHSKDVRELLIPSSHVYVPVMTASGVQIAQVSMTGHDSSLRLPYPAHAFDTPEQWEESSPSVLRLLLITPKQRNLLALLENITSALSDYHEGVEALTGGVNAIIESSRSVEQLLEGIKNFPILDESLPGDYEHQIRGLAKLEREVDPRMAELERMVMKILELTR